MNSRGKRGSGSSPTQKAGATSRVWRARLLKAKQEKTGAHWVQKNEQLAIAWEEASTDDHVASEAITEQLHNEIKRKALSFADIANRLDNSYGWTGIGKASQRFFDHVDCDTARLPELLGNIYSNLLELGSFLEQDSQLSKNPTSAVEPLDVEVRRAFTDLVRTAAPWLRRFPSVRDLDDELGAFLSDPKSLNVSIQVFPIAQRAQLISNADSDVLIDLSASGNRAEGVQSRKAMTYTIRSARNLVIGGAVILATNLSSLYLGATASAVAEHSLIAQRAARFIISAEQHVISLLSDLPADLRLAFESLLGHLKEKPAVGHVNIDSLAVLPGQAPRRRVRRALVFPGQGGQFPGMGRDLAETFTAARRLFEEVDDALSQRLSTLMFEGPESELELSENVQPAILAASLAIMRVLEAEAGFDIRRHVVYAAGHSLGEYSAHAAAGTFSVTDAVRLAKKRGQAMQEVAVPAGEGAMAALLGLDVDIAREVVAAVSGYGICFVANDNCPGQIVISGHFEAVERAIAVAAQRGARRSIMLPVGIPLHCPLMASAAEVMEKELHNVSIRTPVIPVISNVTAASVFDPLEIREMLVEQIIRTVRWRETVLRFKEDEVEEVIEVGPGRVLAGLVKRTDRELIAMSVGTAAEVAELMQRI